MKVLPTYTCHHLKISLALFVMTIGLSACADHLPVPGGSSDINQACFNSTADMQARTLSMHPGMSESEVFSKLCNSSKKESLSRLERREIRTALLGGPDVPFTTIGVTMDPSAETGATEQSDSQIIQNLYGYKLTYRSIKRKHGFTSPIRIRTDESGYDYTVTLIFKDGKLFASPILTGGPVNNVNSSTLFDFITPGTIISRIPGP